MELGWDGQVDGAGIGSGGGWSWDGIGGVDEAGMRSGGWMELEWDGGWMEQVWDRGDAWSRYGIFDFGGLEDLC